MPGNVSKTETTIHSLSGTTFPDDPGTSQASKTGGREVRVQENSARHPVEPGLTMPETTEARDRNIKPAVSSVSSSVRSIQFRPAKTSFFDRAVAAVVIFVLDLKNIRDKVPFRRMTLVKMLNRQLRKNRKKLQQTSKSQNVEEVRQLKQRRIELKANKKAAIVARNDEIRSYVQLIRSLRKLGKGKIAAYSTHIDGLVLGNAMLRDVDLTVKAVDLIKNEDGSVTPKIALDCKGWVDISTTGEPPVKMLVSISDLSASFKGRLVPALNDYLKGKSLTGIVKAVHQARKGSQNLFQLNKSGVDVGALNVTLAELPPKTMAALRGYAPDSMGEQLDGMLAGIAHPFDFTLEHVRVSRAGHADHVLDITGLKAEYSVPELKKGASDGEEGRAVSLSVASIDLNTDSVAETLYEMVKETAVVPMTILPGDGKEEMDWLEVIQQQSSGLTVQGKDLTMKFHGRMAPGPHGGLALSADHRVKAQVENMTLTNHGQAGAGVQLNSTGMTWNSSVDSQTLTIGVETVSADLDLKQSLKPLNTEIDCHGRIKGNDFRVSLTKTGQGTSLDTSAARIHVDTHDRASRVSAGETRLQLPANIQCDVEDIAAITRTGGEASTLSTIKTSRIGLHGEGTLSMASHQHKFNLPVRGEAEVADISLNYKEHEEGRYGQAVRTMEVALGDVAVENVNAGFVTAGGLHSQLDNKTTGTLSMNQVHVDGNKIIQHQDVIPPEYRSYLPARLLKDRSLNLSINLVVESGRIVPSKSTLSGLELDQSAVDTSSWTDWGIKGAVSAGQSLAGALGKRLYLKDIYVWKGFLYASVGIPGGGFSIPICQTPDDFVHNGELSIPAMLHQFTGAYWQEMAGEDRKVIEQIESGKLKTLAKLSEHCQRTGRHRAEHLLNSMDIKNWLEKIPDKDPLVRNYLLMLAGVMAQYPGSAGRVLTIYQALGERLPEELAQRFQSPAFRDWVDPVALSAELAAMGRYTDATAFLNDGLKKTPDSARLNYHMAEVMYQWLEYDEKGDFAPGTEDYIRRTAAGHLTKSVSYGWPGAEALQTQMCEAGDNYARLARVGRSLATDTRSGAFYQTLSELEELAGNPDDMIKTVAKSILSRRADNALKLFVYAEDSDVKDIEQLSHKLEDDEADDLLPAQIYQQGLRYLYGVEGIPRDVPKAEKLLLLAEKQGEGRAAVHLAVIDEKKSQ